jgi:C1A family cysteine protease
MKSIQILLVFCPFLMGCNDFLATPEAASILKAIKGEKPEQSARETADFLALPSLSSKLSKAKHVEPLPLERLVSVHQKYDQARRSKGLGLAGKNRLLELSKNDLQLLLEHEHLKKYFDGKKFKKIDQNWLLEDSATTGLRLTESSKTLSWNVSQDTVVASVIKNIPIRNQGQRGTCASFASLGSLEAFLLKKYNTLDSIDLSEQRYYYMSKPRHWKNGGSLDEEGSNPAVGMAKSLGLSLNDQTFPPNSPSDFNIPLESQCSYQASAGSNDLQVPQSEECFQGVVRITDFAGYMYQPSKRLSTPQQIFDYLVTEELPVIIATKLSDNWEAGKPMITLSEAGQPGSTEHASGHAYLIVGAKKIAESSYPGEGGMCFIIRNSWGTGWGSSGYSCITLAWFNAYRYPTGFPVILNASLDPDKFEAAELYHQKNPTEYILPTEQQILDNSYVNSSTPTKGKVLFMTGDQKTNYQRLENYTSSSLVVENHSSVSTIYFEDGATFFLRGVLQDHKTLTPALTLKVEGDILSTDRQGDHQRKIGRIDRKTSIIYLCSMEYSAVCSLRIDQQNQIRIELTDREEMVEKSSGDFSWKQVSLGSYGFEFSKPRGVNTKVDLRLDKSGKKTDPIRLALDPLSGDILFLNQSVGNVLKGSFCSGDFADSCILSLAEDQFAVLPNINGKTP